MAKRDFETKNVNISLVLFGFLKSAFASAIMGAGVFYLHSTLLTIDAASGLLNMIIDLSVLVVAGVAIYFAAARVLGCPEIAAVQDMFLPFFNRLRSGRR